MKERARKINMNLKCKIRGKEYNLLVQGSTFSEEYNETLDSGTIIIAHVAKIRNLKPYDDVFIYDNEFNGFDENGVVIGSNRFYKHMLVQSFTEEFVNRLGKTYKYKTSLMSEIKALEKIQLPNISITQPLKSKKISIYEYLIRFVELYSPKIKVSTDKNNKKWEYQPKYRVDPKLKDIFGDTYSPDFSLNLPSLRDVLSKLMIVKDMIPYVEDNVIKAMNITQRKNKMSFYDLPVTNIVTNMTSDDFCQSLKRTYSEALSESSTCSSIEYIGFRNSDSALMTLENMRLETRFPIYKINKLYMCYYKKSDIIKTLDSGEKQNYIFLCKQDITKLVKLNRERNGLKKDWEDFKKTSPKSIDELAEYKLATIGYDIGSNYLTGFGEMFTYPKGWWKQEQNTYLENIISAVDSISRNGIENYDSLIKNLTEDEKNSLSTVYSGNVFKTIITPFSAFVDIPNFIPGSQNLEIFINNTLEENTSLASASDMKGILFIIDYQGFYDGALVHSKDYADSDYIVANDNSSSSLALLEIDGLSQKEKVNRLGNKTYQFTVRYDGDFFTKEKLLNLGDVLTIDDEDDIIVYHREYSIYDNYVLATYFGAQDYVLKNYYTSVYARHRTWNLMSYGESVRRSENRKLSLLFSKEKFLYENKSIINFPLNFVEMLLSGFKDSGEIISLDNFNKDSKINYAYITREWEEDDEEKTDIFLTDINIFSSGQSLCLNLRMFDNISMGTYVKSPTPFWGKEYNELDGKWEQTKRSLFNNHQLYSGSAQEIHTIIDDEETGFTKRMGFYVAHFDSESKFPTTLIEYNKPLAKEDPYVYKQYYENFLMYPKVNEKVIRENVTKIIGNTYDLYKDNKEYIDMTYQIEYISQTKDIMIGQWFIKLSDIFSKVYKTNTNKKYKYTLNDGLISFENALDISVYCSSKSDVSFNENHWLPVISFALNIKDIEKCKELLNNLEKISFFEKSSIILFDMSNENSNALLNKVCYLELIPLNLLLIDDEKITIRFNQIIGYKPNGINKEISFNSNEVTLDFFYVKEIGGINFEETYHKKLFGSTFTGFDLSDGTTLRTNNAIIYLYNGYQYIESKWEETQKFDETVLYYGSEISKNYYKNMYMIESSQPLNENIAYDKYFEPQIPEHMTIKRDLTPSDVFNVEMIGNYGYCINIKYDYKKQYIDSSWNFNDEIDYKSIEIRGIYFDCSGGARNFSGIKTEGKIMYYFNETTQDWVKVYDGYSETQKWVYGGYKYLSVTGTVYLTDDNINVLFDFFNKNAVRTKEFEIKSLQYWFKDIVDDSEPIINGQDKKNYMNFVFGINITEKDLIDNNGNIKIYTSLISNRDENVYDENHNVIGKVRNYIKNSEVPYGINQYYDDIIE